MARREREDEPIRLAVVVVRRTEATARIDVENVDVDGTNQLFFIVVSVANIEKKKRQIHIQKEIKSDNNNSSNNNNNNSQKERKRFPSATD